MGERKFVKMGAAQRNLRSWTCVLPVAAFVLVVVQIVSLRSSVASLQASLGAATNQIAQVQQQQRIALATNTDRFVRLEKQLETSSSDLSSKRINTLPIRVNTDSVVTAPVSVASRDPCAGLADVWTKCFAWITEEVKRCEGGNYQANCASECCQQKHERHVTGKIPVLPADYLSCDNERSPSHLGRGSEYTDTLTIQGTARKGQLSKDMMQLLVEAAAVLTAANITYWLHQGTALAAWRHGELMPWDTDIDIGVPVESFDQMWALKAEFGRKGLQLRPGKYPCDVGLYKLACKWLEQKDRRTSKVFSRIEFASSNPKADERIHLDVFFAYPLTLSGKKVRNLSGSAKVLGEDDFQAMAKVQPCYVAGNKFSCPGRIKQWLCRVYGDLSIQKQDVKKWKMHSTYFNDQYHMCEGSYPGGREGKTMLKLCGSA